MRFLSLFEFNKRTIFRLGFKKQNNFPKTIVQKTNNFVRSQRHSTFFQSTYHQNFVRYYSTHSLNETYSTENSSMATIVKKPFERLSPHIKPSHYNLHLTVDVEKFTFR
jgi:hypothetical protein